MAAVHVMLPDGFDDELQRVADWLTHLAAGLSPADADQAHEAARRLRCMAGTPRRRFAV